MFLRYRAERRFDRAIVGASFLSIKGWQHRRAIRIGHRNQMEVEVLDGLAVGDEVVLHPPNQLQDGLRIRK